MARQEIDPTRRNKITVSLYESDLRQLKELIADYCRFDPQIMPTSEYLRHLIGTAHSKMVALKARREKHKKKAD